MAIVSINTAQDFVDLMTGVYGYGSNDDRLYVTVTANIDLASVSAFNPGNHTWYIFFNGGGHRIKNITFTGITADFYLFGAIDGWIKDVVFEDINISAKNVYLFNTNGSTGDGLFNVLVSGSVTADTSSGSYKGAVRIFLNQHGTTDNVEGCSFKGSVIGRTVYLFNGASYGCTAVLSHITSGQDAYIFGGTAVLGVAIIDRFEGNSQSRPIFGGSSTYCYAVIKSASNAVNLTNTTNPTYDRVPVLYDSDVAAAGNVTINRGIAETTANLKDWSYMLEVRRFPS